jgi:hypothetical protein
VHLVDSCVAEACATGFGEDGGSAVDTAEPESDGETGGSRADDQGVVCCHVVG